MAKVKSIYYKGTKGKLAGATLYTTRGVTILRDVNDSPRNPRTDAQMAHRTKLANLVNFYQLGRSYFARAFENKPRMNSDYNKFVSLNLASSPVYLTKQDAGLNVAVPADYQMTEGLLECAGVTTAVTTGTNDISASVTVAGLTISATTTIGDLTSALISAGGGWKAGDQLSIVVAKTVDGKFTFGKAEIILVDGSTGTLATVLNGLMTASSGSLTVSAGKDAILGVCACRSYTDHGKTYVSTSYMKHVSGADAPDYTSEYAKSVAIASYK